ncbi:MAG: EVE domain-containing protein [Thermoanaerobaculia bacterium]|nr:EVE domain-containing protein [Thermoanaerobaculia bacterium]
MSDDRRYWLVKSEPDVYSLHDLERDGTTYWDGVRNYQARNMMRDDMKTGDLVLYYHSNTNPPGIVGLAKVVQEGYPDPTQFDSNDKHYDPKSKADNPRWYVVDVEFVAHFDQKLDLQGLKEDEALDGMILLRKGNRLSVMPVEEHHFQRVLDLAGYAG